MFSVVVEPLIMFVMAYLAYVLAVLFGWSGIIRCANLMSKV